MARFSPVVALTICLLPVACGSGTISTGGEDAHVEPDADDPGDGLCATIVCPGVQVCVAGRCLNPDACVGVECSNPGEVCDPRDGSCHAGATDDDGDGVTIGDGDCDDGDAAVHPGAAELCDGADQDCDLEVDEGFPDADGDGFDTCGFGNPAQADCDDTRATVAPGLAEACDGVDNDCDAAVDDGIAERPCTTTCGAGTERCEGGAWACSSPTVCECTPAGSEQQEACGSCGTRSRTCGAGLSWSEWSACTGGGECAPGAVGTEGCGYCGTRSRTCTAACAWGTWGACGGEGECSPGETFSQSCGDCGTMSTTCSAACTWGAWSSCYGTGGCSEGYQCLEDGSCWCGPYPEWGLKNGVCVPSCGTWLWWNGYLNDGGGCCPAGCAGDGGLDVACDCTYCCASPPGCL